MPFPKNRKREQRQSYILRELGPVLRELFQDNEKLSSLFVTRVELSPNGTVCNIFFSTFEGGTEFETALETLKLFKPSIRKALSTILYGRRTPFVKFRYDAGQDKARRMHELFSQINEEEPSLETPDPKEDAGQ